LKKSLVLTVIRTKCCFLRVLYISFCGLRKLVAFWTCISDDEVFWGQYFLVLTGHKIWLELCFETRKNVLGANFDLRKKNKLPELVQEYNDLRGIDVGIALVALGTLFLYIEALLSVFHVDFLTIKRLILGWYFFGNKDDRTRELIELPLNFLLFLSCSWAKFDLTIVGLVFFCTGLVLFGFANTTVFYFVHFYVSFHLYLEHCLLFVPLGCWLHLFEL